jgi:hypothetical protein
MYQNCCKKCGSIALHTEAKGNNTGLYCDDCGVLVKWLGKDELRAFEHSMREATKEEIESVDSYIANISKPTGVNFYDAETVYRQYKLNLDKVNTVDDCKKILKFLCGLAIKPLSEGVEYGGFSEVSDYFSR